MQLVWEKIGKMGVNGGSRIGDFCRRETGWRFNRRIMEKNASAPSLIFRIFQPV